MKIAKVGSSRKVHIVHNVIRDERPNCHMYLCGAWGFSHDGDRTWILGKASYEQFAAFDTRCTRCEEAYLDEKMTSEVRTQ